MRLIIFDFDGVIADSEQLANAVLADGLTKAGLPTTTEQALQLYMGRRWADCLPMMEERLGKSLPKGFLKAQITKAHIRIVSEVVAVPGLEDFLATFDRTPRCIASSSKLDYIGQCLDRMALAHWFERRFSAHDVPRGKPHPDLFLKAAATMDVRPSECVVIEDSLAGVQAGHAAGMLTFGLCAGNHVLDGHAERLKTAGAHAVVSTYSELAQRLQPVFAP
jgi:HAD superfamily hydrolase (TIGR01509 family)